MKQLRLLPLLLLLLPLDVSASGEQIQNFSSTVHITKQNRVEIAETIDYDFGSTPHHGIFRDVPMDYHDSEGKTYHLAFKKGSVTDESGRSLKVEYSNLSGQKIIKIGDPDVTITGLHTYKISYTITPLINQKDGRDHLALDITGNGWDVPIRAASAVISIDDGATFMSPACFAKVGTLNSEGTCTIIPRPMSANEGVSPPLTVSSSVTLLPGDGLTVEAYLPNGYVDHYLVAGQAAPLTSDDIPMIAAGVVTFAVTLCAGIIFLMRWQRRQVRRRRQTVIAQYEPPDQMTAGEIGYLVDDKSDMKEITATLIDLAVRGYIKIEQSSPKKWYSAAQYTLHKLKDSDDGMNGYEKQLFAAIFGGSTSMAVKDFNKESVASAVAAAKNAFRNRLTARGYYGDFSKESGLLKKALETGNLSEEGAAEWAKVEGFKLYLNVAEKDRLNFSDAPERTPELFSKLLPYAIALGVEREWAKQFEDMDLAPATSWYSGYGAYTVFSAGDMVGELGGSFAGAVASNSTVSSSGGGGSSGGGFGGGGGGSW